LKYLIKLNFFLCLNNYSSYCFNIKETTPPWKNCANLKNISTCLINLDNFHNAILPERETLWLSSILPERETLWLSSIFTVLIILFTYNNMKHRFSIKFGILIFLQLTKFCLWWKQLISSPDGYLLLLR
jgi:hypothetical protein